MADFLLRLVLYQLLLFSSTIVLLLKKVAMFEFCCLCSYSQLFQLNEFLVLYKAYLYLVSQFEFTEPGSIHGHNPHQILLMSYVSISTRSTGIL